VNVVTLLIISGVAYWFFFRGQSTTVGQSTVNQLPGAAGIVQTMGLMRAMVNGTIADPLIRRQAVRATDFCGRGNKHCSATAIGEWVRSKMKYVPDPLNHEHLTSPAVIAKAIEEGKRVYGDCDDMSMYVAALAKSIGLAPTFEVVGRDKQFHHVYTSVNGIPVDPTVPAGKNPFHAKRHLSLKV
jgi:hypothetical protein